MSESQPTGQAESEMPTRLRIDRDGKKEQPGQPEEGFGGEGSNPS